MTFISHSFSNTRLLTDITSTLIVNTQNLLLRDAVQHVWAQQGGR